ncbi:3'-phosphoadenosine 5'-phosphosulfate sulfotransferase [Gnomoniopsis smithogilvyi]|uniref:FAD synthase n=1 Tax=Gnomoniopsis smithogilvyi TaxID=1191159 RepID=A0A9W8YLE1_9PEZI|nr:3'-phosphoadenosine 5'-phosphosulfate sulfotransferase [Gnomoniopsis smithogilvyi]
MLQGHHHSNGSAAANGGVKVDDGATAAAAPNLRQVCLELQDKVEAFLAEDVDTKILKSVQAQVKEAVGVIDEALDRYSIEELSLSYNGGKDCLVLLVLILACLPRHFEPTPAPATATTASSSTGFHNGIIHAHSQPPPNTPLSNTPRATTPSPFPESLQSVYIVSPHPFAEIDEFVETSTVKFHLDLCRYALPMREALEAYLKERPRLKAVFVGTRRTDPHGANLTHFDETDAGWPAFVRVHPVIDWHYTEIWAFIRHLQIPYISLYDQGYTSLGGTQDTFPNPKLKNDDNAEGFRPAYELTEDDEERLGRDR